MEPDTIAIAWIVVAMFGSVLGGVLMFQWHLRDYRRDYEGAMMAMFLGLLMGGMLGLIWPLTGIALLIVFVIRNFNLGVR